MVPSAFCSICACSCSMRRSAINCWCSLLAADAGSADRNSTRTMKSVCLISSLRSDNEMRTAVLGPRPLFVTGIERELLAVADRSQPIRGNTHRDEVRASGGRAPLAQRKIVLGGAALVGVPFDRHGPAGVALQER